MSGSIDNNSFILDLYQRYSIALNDAKRMQITGSPTRETSGLKDLTVEDTIFKTVQCAKEQGLITADTSKAFSSVQDLKDKKLENLTEDEQKQIEQVFNEQLAKSAPPSTPSSERSSPALSDSGKGASGSLQSQSSDGEGYISATEYREAKKTVNTTLASHNAAHRRLNPKDKDKTIKSIAENQREFLKLVREGLGLSVEQTEAILDIKPGENPRDPSDNLLLPTDKDLQAEKIEDVPFPFPSQFNKDFIAAQRSHYIEFKLPGHEPFRVTTRDEGIEFLSQLNELKEIISLTEDNPAIKTKLLSLLCLFASQHSGNGITGPYQRALSANIQQKLNFALMEAFGNREAERPIEAAMLLLNKFTTDSSSVQITLSPVVNTEGQIIQNQFTVHLKAHMTTKCDISPPKPQLPTKEETLERAKKDKEYDAAREVLGIGEVIGGNIEASMIVGVDETGKQFIKILESKYTLTIKE